MVNRYLPKGWKGSASVCKNALPVGGLVVNHCHALEIVHLPIFLSFIIIQGFLHAVPPLRPSSAYQLESGTE